MNVSRGAQWASFGVLLALYAASAPHTVALEDDGEFILAGRFLGIAHPPGYPIHTLLAFLASLLPFGSVAYRVHLLSALFGALAAAALYACARRLGVRPLLVAGGVLALGVSRVFWSQAIVAEVYTLHVFLFACALLLALRLHDGGGGRDAVLLALVTGMALANHWPLMVLAAPALLVLAWRRWRELLGAPALAAGALAALSPYAWMMLRSQQEPLISFAGPIRTLGELWHYVLRSGYAGVDHRPLAGWDDRVRFAQFAFAEWGTQLTLGGAALALFGLAWLWRRGERATVLALGWSVAGLTALLVMRLDFEYFAQSAAAFRVYPLTAYAATALLAGCGLEALARLERLRGPALAPVLAAALVAALALGNAAANWRPHDGWGEAYALAMLREVPADAQVVADPDWAATTLGYAHFIDGHCAQCTLLQPQGLMFPSRAFDPLRTAPADQARLLEQQLASTLRPRAYTDRAPPGMAVSDRWLVQVVDPRAGPDSFIELSASAHEFFRRHVAVDDPHDATLRTVQQALRRRYFETLAAAGRIEPGRAGELCQEFYGCLGLVEGMLRQPARHPAPDTARLLEAAAVLEPTDAHRWDRARVLEVRGLLLERMARPQEAAAALQAAVRLAPDASEAAQRGLRRRLGDAP